MTIITQGILGIITLFTGIILPKYMGPEQYGYWQSFFFYVGYLNIIGLGFNDGIILNYAGKHHEQIPYGKLRSAVRIMLCYSLFITAVLFMFALNMRDYQYSRINLLLAFNILPMVLFCILTAFFLATNHSILYNMSNLFQRILFCALSLIFLLNQKQSAANMMISDTIARLFLVLVLAFIGRTILFGKSDRLRDGFNEIKRVCSSGIMIMLSVVFSGLLPSFGRIVIEKHESMQVYGIYSFCISLLSVILSFTSAVGIVAFPMIKTVQSDRLPSCYYMFNNVYEQIGMIMYFIYIPLWFLILNYMPEYSSGLSYLALLLGVCYPLGKIQLIITPYYKAYRMEKELFWGNSIGLFCMVACITVGYFIVPSVKLVAIITFVIMIIFGKSLEYYFEKKQQEHYKLFKWSDILVPIIFIGCTLFGNIRYFTVFYSICVVFKIIVQWKLIKTLR